MEGRMAAAGAGRDANRVDGPDLAPDRRLGRRDDVLLLLLEDVGDLLSQRGRLVVDPGQLIAGRADLLGEVRLRLLLLRLEVDQLGQVGGLLVAQLDLLVARGLLLLQVGVGLGEVRLELALERLGPRARGGGGRGGKKEERDRRGLGDPHHDATRSLRTRPGEGRDPRRGPMRRRTTPITSPACRVNPGASWAKLEAPAWTAIPQARRAR